MNKEIIFGKQIVASALKKQEIIKEIFINKDHKNKFKDIKFKNIKYVSKEKLYLISKSSYHQNIAAIICKYKTYSENELFKKIDSIKNLIVLDHIHDNQNFGSIIRNAYANNYLHIIIPKRRQVSVNCYTHKSSSGTTFFTNIYEVNSLYSILLKLKQMDFWVYSFQKTQNSVSLLSLNLNFEKKILIFGNEFSGISKTLKKISDFLVYIPINSNLDSLNVSSACAIACFWFANH